MFRFRTSVFFAQVTVQEASELAGSKQTRAAWLLSPSYFGWPCNRPRLYTVLVRKDLKLKSGLGIIERLYRVPSVAVDVLLTTPEEPWHHETCFTF